MGWSSGTFTRSTGSTAWADDRDAAVEIEAGLHDTHDNDLANGINQCLNKDGSNAATGDLDLGSQKISSLADPTADQDAATKVYVDTLIVNSYLTLTPSTIGTSEVVEGTITIVIPATWTTYDLECIATGYCYESGTLTANRSVIWRWRETNAVGTELGQTQGRLDGASLDRYPVALFSYQTGETSTGSRDLALTSIISGDSAQASHAAMVARVAAYRLT
jgi:hypothetical protein